MYSSKTFQAILLACFFPTALASASVHSADGRFPSPLPASPSTRCRTRIGPSLPPGTVPTFSTTRTVSCGSTDTSIETVTATPPSSTSTSWTTQTAVTAAGRDDVVATTTNVVTSTASKTSVTTTTVTHVSTQRYITVIPAPSGFIPVLESLHGSSCNGSQCYDPLVKSHPEVQLEERESLDEMLLPRGIEKPSGYPVSVDCTSFTSSCRTVTRISTYTPAAHTAVLTKTTQTVSTTFSSGKATSTSTAQSTVRVTTTIVSTSTVTQSEVSKATFSAYEVCASNNLANNVGPDTFFDIHFSGGNPNAGYALYNANTLYECCVATTDEPDNPSNGQSEGWFWGGPGGCYSAELSGTKCSAGGQTNVIRALRKNGTTGSGVVIGNGCLGVFERKLPTSTPSA